MDLALRARWRNFLYGFWFLPGATAAAFAGLAFALVAVDRAAGTSGVAVLFSGTGSAARTLLSTVAASLITVAGLALSITIVALQLVSGQFSPRATRELLGDRLNQLAAGSFLGVFVYCLLVLRVIRDGTEGFDGFVPSLAVTTAIALGVFGLGMLLVFIHHMAQSIKLPHIASRIGRHTLGAVDELYPDPFGRAEGVTPDEETEEWAEALGPPTLIHSPRPGYVQQARLDELAGRLERPGTRIAVLVAPGDFVTEETPLAALRPRLEPDEEDLARFVRSAITVTDERDLGQDVVFGLQQLKDIALRAMSPSVNDPSTAVTCIGYLGAVLERLSGRSFPPAVRRFDEQDVVLAARRPTFEDYVEEGFGQLPRHVAGDPQVVSQALRALSLAAQAARRSGAEGRLEALAEMAGRLAAPALEEALSVADVERVRRAHERVGAPAAGVG